MTVRVDQVFGGNVGVAAIAAGDVSVWANHVEGNVAVEAISLDGNVTVDVAAWSAVHSAPACRRSASRAT